MVLAGAARLSGLRHVTGGRDRLGGLFWAAVGIAGGIWAGVYCVRMLLKYLSVETV
jgi:hypothetical protein